MTTRTPYTIEDDLDFFQELRNYQEESQSPIKAVCMITGMPLDKYHVTLLCGHTFNYIPLFTEINKQKEKWSCMNDDLTHEHTIQCPYCRNRQYELLPYYAELGLPRKKGINQSLFSLEDTLIGTCKYIKKKVFHVYDDSSENENGSVSFCNETAKLTKHGYYCPLHYSMVDMEKEKESCKHPLCAFILVSGKNKGKKCTRRVMDATETYCIRHALKKA